MRFAAFLFLLTNAALAGMPTLSVDDISSAADHSAGRVSPGEIVVLRVPGVGPEVLVGQTLDARNKVATELAGIRVLFDGVAAPMSFVVAGEVSAVVPYEVAGRASTEVVVESQGERSASVRIPVVLATPALYTLDGTGRGQAGMLNQAGCCNSPDNPAVRGTISSLYATGAGQTTPRGETGRVSAYDSVLKYPRPVLRVRVLVGGVPAKIEYVGNAPHAVAGLLQVNFRVPNNAPLGDAVPVVLVVGEAHSSEAATMAVRSARRQILLIEPSEATRTRLHRALTSVGFDVYAAEDNAAAEKIVTKTAIDLVIASMPSALAVVPNLQAKHTKLKILGTARALDAETLRSADLVGVQAVVSGTIRSNEVIRRARELLRPHLLPYELPRIPAVPVAR